MRISLATLDRVIASGKLKAKKHGHATVVMRREIERNIEDRPDGKTLAPKAARGDLWMVDAETGRYWIFWCSDWDGHERLAWEEPRAVGDLVHVSWSPPRTRGLSAQAASAMGEYGRAGAAGTFFFIDPKDDLFVICVMQTHLHRGRIEEEMARLVYEATR